MKNSFISMICKIFYDIYHLYEFVYFYSACSDKIIKMNNDERWKWEVPSLGIPDELPKRENHTTTYITILKLWIIFKCFKQC